MNTLKGIIMNSTNSIVGRVNNGTGAVDLSNYYTKPEVDEMMGDIEAALDNIIAIQNTLIGGEGE